jgi:hypothetical protein
LERWLDVHDGVAPRQHPEKNTTGGRIDEEEARLAKFVGRMRFANKAGRLPEWARRVLENIPGWTWEHNNQTWEDSYAKLKAWIENMHAEDKCPSEKQIYPVKIPRSWSKED